MAADGFEIFGSKGDFALEVRLLPDDQPNSAPLDSAGSWGEWRLWVAGLNLCNFEYRTQSGMASASSIRWYLAPVFRWFVQNWSPLLHEGRLPSGGRWGDSRPRWARLAYLTMLEGAGDDMRRFDPWQGWASRHALRSAAQGGIVPDVFFHRVNDEIELSWGDRVQPGAESVSFNLEDGMSRVSVDVIACAIRDATDWFCKVCKKIDAVWADELVHEWEAKRDTAARHSALSWFLDGQEEPGRLSGVFLSGINKVGKIFEPPEGSWWGTLAPEVAMFGAVSPQVSENAAAILLASYFESLTDKAEAETLKDLRFEDPAWKTVSPWASGYSLAEDVLDEADPSPEAKRTEIETLITSLGVAVKDVSLSEVGPRGVAFAGDHVQPTILVNTDHPSNGKFGRRFTLGHELCHILFDRDHARNLAHSSTPWAPPVVEQRANAFAAMLLMPRSRAKRPIAADSKALRKEIRSLARRLKVSEIALKRHLVNMGELSPEEGNVLLGEGGIGT